LGAVELGGDMGKFDVGVRLFLVGIFVITTAFTMDREALEEPLRPTEDAELVLPNRPPAHQHEEREVACCWRFTMFTWTLNEQFMRDLLLLSNILLALQETNSAALHELFFKCYRGKHYPLSSLARASLRRFGLLHDDDAVKYLWDEAIHKFFALNSDSDEAFSNLFFRASVQDWAARYPEAVEVLEKFPGMINASYCMKLAQEYGLIAHTSKITKEERTAILNVLKQLRGRSENLINVASLEVVLASYGIKISHQNA
jgi:hypothetical protein